MRLEIAEDEVVPLEVVVDHLGLLLSEVCPVVELLGRVLEGGVFEPDSRRVVD